ncbi:hypothetical protein KSP40_PGU020208 [Platanthera guangdongensis]|uniref:Uncharacterized protein n=1 Tax=Platanthera guangdongensis TaxID=2320717 RepID=A0ABR2MD92_9ASPA
MDKLCSILLMRSGRKQPPQIHLLLAQPHLENWNSAALGGRRLECSEGKVTGGAMDGRDLAGYNSGWKKAGRRWRRDRFRVRGEMKDVTEDEKELFSVIDNHISSQVPKGKSLSTATAAVFAAPSAPPLAVAVAVPQAQVPPAAVLAIDLSPVIFLQTGSSILHKELAERVIAGGMGSLSGAGLSWRSGVSSPPSSKPSALSRHRLSAMIRSAISVERKRLNLQKSEEIFDAAKLLVEHSLLYKTEENTQSIQGKKSTGYRSAQLDYEQA